MEAEQANRCHHYKDYTLRWNELEGVSHLPCPPDFRRPCTEMDYDPMTAMDVLLSDDILDDMQLDLIDHMMEESCIDEIKQGLHDDEGCLIDDCVNTRTAQRFVN